MVHWLFAGFLIAHGLVHVAIWLAPATDDVPFDVRHSWLAGDLGRLGTVAGPVVGAAFVLAGIAFLTGAAWWPAALLVAAVASLAMLVLTFTPWWLLGLAINVALVVVAACELWVR